MRRCVGCLESKPKKDLIRIVQVDKGLTLDSTGKANGRGVYLCPCRECFDKAKKRKALGRSLNVEISEEDMHKLSMEFEKYEK